MSAGNPLPEKQLSGNELRKTVNLISSIARDLERDIRRVCASRSYVRNMLIWHFVIKNGRKNYDESTRPVYLDADLKNLFHHSNINYMDAKNFNPINSHENRTIFNNLNIREEISYVINLVEKRDGVFYLNEDQMNTFTDWVLSKIKSKYKCKEEDENPISFTTELVNRLMNCNLPYTTLLHAREALGMFQDNDLLNDKDFIYKHFVNEISELVNYLYHYKKDPEDLELVKKKVNQLFDFNNNFFMNELPELKRLRKIKGKDKKTTNRFISLEKKQNHVITNIAKIKYFRTLIPRLEHFISRISSFVNRHIENIRLLHEITNGYFLYLQEGNTYSAPVVRNFNGEKAREMVLKVQEVYTGNMNRFDIPRYLNVHPNILHDAWLRSEDKKEKRTQLQIANAVAKNTESNAKREYFRIINQLNRERPKNNGATARAITPTVINELSREIPQNNGAAAGAITQNVINELRRHNERLGINRSSRAATTIYKNVNLPTYANIVSGRRKSVPTLSKTPKANSSNANWNAAISAIEEEGKHNKSNTVPNSNTDPNSNWNDAIRALKQK